MNESATPRRWPLFLIASPAAVAVWSGWVGLGGLCGFGVIHPLPGIWGALRLNTAITLPIGVEAYGAYALGAWLAPGSPGTARVFARRSAIGALCLGMAGQVIYHLLAAAHAHQAPWPVVTLVSCLPVVTLAFGAALTHLLRPGPVRPAAEPGPRTGQDTGARTGLDGLPAAGRTALTPGPGPGRSGPDPGAGARGGPLPPAVPVDRDAVVAELASEVLTAAAAGENWRPDYPALMTRTGRRRSWCEKAVRDARRAALGADAGPRTEPLRAGEPGSDPARTATPAGAAP
jgi:hypothetical protein